MPNFAKFLARSALVFLAFGLVHAAHAADALPAARFVGFMQEFDDFEIGSSRMALQKSSNEAIRSFANRMIVDHEEARSVLARARQEAGVTLAPTPGGLEPRRAAVLDRLGVLQAAEFDTVYVESQLATHLEVVDQVGAYSQNGDIGSLRSYAQTMLPKLQQHLEMAKRLAGR